MEIRGEGEGKMIARIARILIPVILVGMLLVPLALAVASTTVSIKDASAPQGSTVKVPISITDVTGMCGANIWLSYDKNVVTVEKVDNGDLGSITHSIDNDVVGITKMNWDTTEGKAGSFVFAYITLKAVGNLGDTSPLDLDVKELYDCDLNDITHTIDDGTFTCGQPITYDFFDTGSGTYPSIFGTHTGTLKTDGDITVNNMYTYSCTGTGGHTEYVRIYNASGTIAEATWTGYSEDWHNITFATFTLVGGKTYYYEIRTGSYPQIIHATSKPITGGTITCISFVDANGETYNDWIPGIRLYKK